MKRHISIFLILSILLLCLVGCSGDKATLVPTESPTESPTETKKPTQKPTSETKATKKPNKGGNVAMELVSELDLNKFDLTKFLYPIWNDDVCFAEASFVREDADGKVAPLQLLYPITEIISVRSADLKIVYEAGKDYKLTSDGKLEILEGGDIPVLEYNKYHFPNYTSDNLATKFPAADNSGSGYIRAELGPNKPGMSEWTLAVTYKHEAGNVLSVPTDKSAGYARLAAKIEAGESVTVVSMGDSITDGWSSSGKPYVNIAPYCPAYNLLVCQYISTKYNVSVDHKNIAVSGSNSGSGAKNGLGKVDEACAADPDLVIVAYGMNDGCSMPTQDYISNINSIVKSIEERCPEACIVVVGTCLPNSQVGYNPGVSLLKYHLEYALALANAERTEWNNAYFADVTTLHFDMNTVKAYQDTSGSNSNHPNDYMHRIYAQVILRTIFGTYM